MISTSKQWTVSSIPFISHLQLALILGTQTSWENRCKISWTCGTEREIRLGNWSTGTTTDDLDQFFRATRDGWRAQDFHDQCNRKGPTLTVIKVSNWIFGGFSPIDWYRVCKSQLTHRKSSGDYAHDPSAWLFSLSNPENIPVKIEFKEGGPPFSMYDSADYGPTFGGGHDICIQNNANQTSQNYSNLGYSFKLPDRAPQSSCYFTGHSYFTPDEIEVFGLDATITRSSPQTSQ